MLASDLSWQPDGFFWSLHKSQSDLPETSIPAANQVPLLAVRIRSMGLAQLVRHRHQHIVDFEVAIGRERDAGEGGAVLNKRGCGFTNQRGKHALSR